MEDQTKTFVDSHPTQEIQQTNPIEKNRRPTDRSFVFVFAIIIIAWLSISILGLCAHQRHINNHSDQQILDFKSLINEPFRRADLGLTLVMSLFLNTGILFLCIFSYQSFTKFFVHFGMGIYMFSAIVYFYQIILGSMTDYDVIDEYIPYEISKCFVVISQIWIFVRIIIMIATVASFFKVEQTVLRNIFEDFCRVIFYSPIIVIFSGLVTILGCSVFIFTVNALITEFLSDRSVYRTVPDCCIMILGSICALNFIFYFALMVISEYAVNYYWKNGGPVVLIKCIGQTLRNHTGTIMFSSTPCVPAICAIVQAFKHNRPGKNKENYIFYVASKVSLVLGMEYIALIFSSIYGAGFVKSTKKTFDAVLCRCSLYLATLGVTDAAIDIFSLISAFFAAIWVRVETGNVGNKMLKTDRDSLMKIASVSYGFIIPVMTFYILMYFSARALLINKIIILNKKERYTEGKTEVLNRL